MLLIMFIWAHLCIQQMFALTISYFEPLMIFVSAVISTVAENIELFSTYPYPSELSGLHLVIQIVHGGLESVLHFLAGSLDALKVSWWAKFALATCFLSSLTFAYINSILTPWSTNTICVWEKCATPAVVFRAAKANEIMFALKVLTNLMLGYPYAVLTALFIHPHSTPRRLTLVTRWLDRLIRCACYKSSTDSKQQRVASMVGGTLPQRKSRHTKSSELRPQSTCRKGNEAHEDLMVAADFPSEDAESVAVSRTSDLVIATEFPEETELVSAFHFSHPVTASKNLFIDVFDELPMQRPNALNRVIPLNNCVTSELQ